MKRIISFILIASIFILSCFGVGCFYGEINYDSIEINIVLCEGSTETYYYMGAAERFEESVEDKMYFDLYQGVNVDVILCNKAEFNLEYQSFAGYDIYLTTADMDPYVRNYINKGYILSMDSVFLEASDVVNDSALTVEDKIDPSALSAYKSDDFEYYAVPNSSEIVGLIYDVNAFDRWGYFLADDITDAVIFESELTNETYYFTMPTHDHNLSTYNKTAGVDGVYGTEDDGLPRTLNEFVALCEYIKYNDKYPFISAGAEAYKSDYLVQALTYALMGYEEARACMDLEGKLQVVTGYTNEPLFPGLPKEYGEIFKPIVQTVELTESTGYYASWSLAKYYAEAFMDLSVKMDWWADCSNRTYMTASDAHKEFLFSGYDLVVQEALMLLESSNWFAKLEESGELTRFNAIYNNKRQYDRRLKMMSMPTLFDGKEEYAESRTRQTFQQVHPTYLVLANALRRSSSKTEACKDFLKFLCTEQECNYYTIATGIRKDLKYDFELLDLYENSEYYGALEQIVYNADIVYLSSKTQTFKSSPSYFEGGKNDSRFFYYKRILYEDEMTGDVYSKTYKTAYEYFRDFRDPNTKTCFANRLYTKETWNEVYDGYAEIGAYLDKNGKPVVFNG